MSKATSTAPPAPRSTQEVQDDELLTRAYQAVLTEVQARGQMLERDKFDRAFALAKVSHQGQRRKSGEPYLIHPLRVAHTIARLGLDADAIVAGMLHDSVEDSELTLFELAEQCGEEVSRLVDGVTKLGKLPFLDRQRRQVESFRKFVLAMSKDVRVLLLKLADRLDNMRTLDAMAPKKKARISRETMEIYAPLAGRLGIDVMRRELQDLAFRYIDAATYLEVSERMQRVRDEDPGFEEEVRSWLLSLFEAGAEAKPASEDGPSAYRQAWDKERWGEVEVKARFRTVHQVHCFEQLQLERKEERGGGGDAQDSELHIGELIQFQIITKNYEACYLALGHIHAHTRARSRECLDYIAIPRQNRYQGLHTEIYTRYQQVVQLQIRSQSMQEIAERGVVSDLRQGRESDPATIQWLRDVSDSHSNLQDPREFFVAVRDELFAEEVYVRTPQGETLALPRNSTPIDFAFFVHTEVGLHCSGARVNGQFVPLRYQLRSGDTVEILTDPRVRPKPAWLNMCASSRARTRINQFIRQTLRSRHLQLGKELLGQALDQRALKLSRIEEVEELSEVLARMGISPERGLSGIYESIGAEELDAEELLRELFPREPKGARRGFLSRVFSSKEEPAPVAGRSLCIRRDALEGRGMTHMRLAKCCSPLPGEGVTGVLQSDGEIEVHVEPCWNAVHSNRRKLALTWEEGLEIESSVTLEVQSKNREGLLAQMSRCFAQLGINIRQANCRVRSDGKRAINTFDVTLRRAEELEAAITSLEALEGIYGVQRKLHDQGPGDEEAQAAARPLGH